MLGWGGSESGAQKPQQLVEEHRNPELASVLITRFGRPFQNYRVLNLCKSINNSRRNVDSVSFQEKEHSRQCLK